MKYFPGIDIGATKTAAPIADENGNQIGTGQGNPGNHEDVGFDGVEKPYAKPCMVRFRTQKSKWIKLSNS
jgi:hypothetical protein